jgi:hypothetical protein
MMIKSVKSNDENLENLEGTFRRSSILVPQYWARLSERNSTYTEKEQHLH